MLSLTLKKVQINMFSFIWTLYHSPQGFVVKLKMAICDCGFYFFAFLSFQQRPSRRESGVGGQPRLGGPQSPASQPPSWHPTAPRPLGAQGPRTTASRSTPMGETVQSVTVQVKYNFITQTCFKSDFYWAQSRTIWLNWILSNVIWSNVIFIRQDF